MQVQGHPSLLQGESVKKRKEKEAERKHLWFGNGNKGKAILI
jgi:hypothetical protein